MIKREPKGKAKSVAIVRNSPSSSARLGWVSFFLILALLLLVGRITYLQVIPGEKQGYEFLQKQANRISVRKESIPAYRGMITDRNGEPLAVSTPMVNLVLDPLVFLDAYDTGKVSQRGFSLLAKAANTSTKKLLKRIRKVGKKRYLMIAKKLRPSVYTNLKAFNFPGLRSKIDYQRYYPAGEVVAQLVGLTNYEDQGQQGLELSYDDYLRGESGQRAVVQNIHRHRIRELGVLKEPKDGGDLKLTIDMRLQYAAYRELKKAVKKHQAKGGSIVLIDIQTGDILAMASLPSFNPNNKAKLDIAATRNRALTDLFEPGSTMKPLTMSVALTSGKYTKDTIIDASKSSILVDGHAIQDPVTYGKIPLIRVITKSSQVGTTKVALTLDPHKVRNTFYGYGLGQAVGTDFPGEAEGLLPYRDRWSDIERATFAFGYGLSVTAAQLANAYAVLGREGEWKAAKVVVSPAVVELPEHRVVSQQVADDVIDMMKTVVSNEGTAKAAQISGYQLAGKTGTAHKVGKTGYQSNYTAVFAGLAPADHPRFAAAIVIDAPTAGGYHGGQVAAPVFGHLMSDVLRLRNIAPDPTMLDKKKR